MRAGSLRRQVVLQQPTPGINAFGQQPAGWSNIATVAAQVEQLQGRELQAAQAINAETTHKVTIRYRTGLTAANRVMYQGRIFNVQAVIDPNTDHIQLELLCSEGLNQG